MGVPGMYPSQPQMNMGAVPQQGTMGAMHHVAAPQSPHRPAVVATKHVILPVTVSSHHVSDKEVLYDIEFQIEEYFPDGSKAVHKHQISENLSSLKKIHDAVYHGELVKAKLEFPHQGVFERKESDKKVAERMSELKVYLDTVLASSKALTDRTFNEALHCDKNFELHLAHTAGW